MLEAQARPALLGGRLVAAFALAARRVLQRMAFVEDDDAVKVRAQPVNDLA
jgi:hypothetical protein